MLFWASFLDIENNEGDLHSCVGLYYGAVLFVLVVTPECEILVGISYCTNSSQPRICCARDWKICGICSFPQPSIWNTNHKVGTKVNCYTLGWWFDICESPLLENFIPIYAQMPGFGLRFVNWRVWIRILLRDVSRKWTNIQSIQSNE